MMEETASFHNTKKQSPFRRMKWVEKLGIRKEYSMYFLAIFRNPLMKFRCLRATAAISSPSSSSSEADDDDEQENEDSQSEDNDNKEVSEVGGGLSSPQDKIVLMRCKSAPAKGWWSNGDDAKEKAETSNVESKDSERRILMSYAPDFFMVSPEIAKEMLPRRSVSIYMHKSRSFRR